VPALEREAQRIAEHIIAALDYVGVLTVEFFLVGGELLVNEMAPGPTIQVTQHRQRRLQPVRVAGARPVRSAAAGTG
jgi:formate-dependent phosphoribosylglycinamide formyltransferase (GAR transformylase)